MSTADPEQPKKEVSEPNRASDADQKPSVSSAPNGADQAKSSTYALRDFFSQPKAIMELFGLLVLLAYTFFAGLQSCTMNQTLEEIRMQTPKIAKSADAAKDAADTGKITLESGQRAFISVAQLPQITTILDPNNPQRIVSYRFRSVLSNDGLTPTRDAMEYGNGFPTAYRHPIGVQFRFPDQGNHVSTPFVLGPKQTVTAGFLEYTAEALSQVVRHENRLYFYGWITYHDIFPHTPQHVTMFCQELSIQGDVARVGAALLTYDLCGHHNCADDDCKGESYSNPPRLWP